MAIPVALQSFKAAGIYKVVYDKSTILGEDTNILRLVVGYSEQGPFNVPTYVSSVSEFKKIYGDISKKLEKRGVYFHRVALQALTRGPILCLNLKKFATEQVEAAAISTEPKVGAIKNVKYLVEDIYDTTRFWQCSADKLNTIQPVSEIKEGEIIYAQTPDTYIKISATDTLKTSNTFFIRKASGSKVNGYNISINDWYKDSGEEIPEYLQDKLDAQVSDFFAEIYVFRGEFTKQQIVASESLQEYFDIVDNKLQLKPYVLDAYGDKIDTLDALYNDPVAGGLTHYVGALIPYFKTKTGTYASLDILFNSDRDTHFMMMAFDTDKLEPVDGTDPVNIDLSVSNDAEAVLKAIKDGKTSCLGNENSPVNVTTIKTEVKDSNKIVLVETDSYEDAVNGSSATVIAVKGGSSKIEGGKYDGLYAVAIEDPIAERVSEGDVFIAADNKSFVTVKAIGLSDGDLLDDDNDLTGVIDTDALNAALGVDDGKPYIIIFDGDPSTASPFEGDDSGKYVTRVELSFNNEIGVMRPIFLKGYEYQNDKPAGTDMMSKLNWQNFQLSALSDYKGLRTGLLNKSDIDYRYIVDGFESYVGQGIKNVLCGLAKDKQSAFAILNFPSIQTFIKCPYASYTDNKGVFNVQYIVDGFNKKKPHSQGFSLPSDTEGASFCAFYTPLKFSDGYIDSIVPSAGIVSNLFIGKYMTRHPYDIIAGPNYGAISASGLIGPDYNYSMDELQIIEPYGVNCMVYRPTYGTFINANQTAKQTPKSALSSVNVRELIIYLQDEIEKLLQSYQWEFNNQTVRNKIKDRADSICTQVMQNGGIQDFMNVMDESNNTPEIIDNEMAVLSTHIEPGRGMGKMVHELTIYRTGQMRSVISQ